MRSRAFLSLCYLGLILNLSLLAAGNWLRSSDPVKGIKLTTQADAILIYGQNRFGFSSLKVFSNWKETQEYLEARNLGLPKFSVAHKGIDPFARLTRKIDKEYFLITWRPQTQGLHRITFGVQQSARPQEEKPRVLHTPDAASALAILQQIQHAELLGGVYGHSLQLEPIQ